MHTTMVPEQVKTMKIQAGIQVSRPRELRRQLQLWKRFGRLYLIVFVLVRNVLLSSTIPTFQYHPFLIASSMDQGDKVSNLWVTITSENVAITFDVNEELSILMGDLRRKRGASEHCCNELNVMLDARDGDNFLQRHEIDRLVGENRDLRAHIGSLEFEITRLRGELEGGYY
ncbi:hypothetical protein Tco_0158992 [Tanacetum coccineum]